MRKENQILYACNVDFLFFLNLKGMLIIIVVKEGDSYVIYKKK